MSIHCLEFWSHKLATKGLLFDSQRFGSQNMHAINSDSNKRIISLPKMETIKLTETGVKDSEFTAHSLPALPRGHRSLRFPNCKQVSHLKDREDYKLEKCHRSKGIEQWFCHHSNHRVKSIVRLNAFSSVLYQTTIVVPAMRTEFKIDRHLSRWQTVGISVVQKHGKTNYMGYHHHLLEGCIACPLPTLQRPGPDLQPAILI